MEGSARLSYIDIFAGCGGMALGLYESGWKGMFAIERDPMAFGTLRHNLVSKKHHFDWPAWLPKTEHDINEVIRSYPEQLKALQDKVDLVVGGPPCQGFSLAGRRNRNDTRNNAVYSYIKFIKLVKPRALFFENVRGFTIGFKAGRGRSKPYSDFITSQLADLKYNVHSEVVNFADFGVPQERHRFILVGLQDGDAKSFYEKLRAGSASFLERKDMPSKPNVRDAISDIKKGNGEVGSPDSRGFMAGIYTEPKSRYQKAVRKDCDYELPDSHRFARHGKATIKKFRQIMGECERGKAVSERMRKALELNKKSITPLDGGMPSPTLTTLPDDYIHYSEARILTVREYARLQSFKDWYEITGKYTTGGRLRKLEVPRYTQVGNAIPPLFAEQAGDALKGMLK